MVLVALSNAGLKLKPSKSEWCRDEIKFLGHVVNAQGVQTQQKTVQKVQSFNRPHSQKTVKSFLGLCNYCRSFVPNFAAVAGPLNKLLRKDIPFEWNEKCEEAFQTLKESLTLAPFLIHPDIGGHFHVLMDASDTACSTEKGVGDTCGIPQESGGQAKCQKEQVTSSPSCSCSCR